MVFNLNNISAVFTFQWAQRRQAFYRWVIRVVVEELGCGCHDDVFLVLGQEINRSFGDSLTLSLFLLGHFCFLWSSILRGMSIGSSILFVVNDVMSWWIQHFRGYIYYAVTQIIVQAIGSWALAAATLLFTSCHLNLHVILRIDPRASRKWRFWSDWKHCLRCVLHRLLSGKSIEVDLFIQITVVASWILSWAYNICSLKCIDTIQSRPWTKYLLLSQVLVSLCLLPWFRKPFASHVFSALEEVKEYWACHQHGVPHSCISLTIPPDKTVRSRAVRELIDNGARTLTIAYKTTWDWNKVILLYELFWIDQFQSLICFMIRLILPHTKCISWIYNLLCLIQIVCKLTYRLFTSFTSLWWKRISNYFFSLDFSVISMRTHILISLIFWRDLALKFVV